MQPDGDRSFALSQAIEIVAAVQTYDLDAFICETLGEDSIHATYTTPKGELSVNLYGPADDETEFSIVLSLDHAPEDEDLVQGESYFLNHEGLSSIDVDGVTQPILSGNATVKDCALEHPKVIGKRILENARLLMHNPLTKKIEDDTDLD